MAGATTRIERVQQLTRALELRTRGCTIAEVAAELGISPRSVDRRLAEALRLLGEETADQLRRMVEHRHNDMLGRLYALLDRELSPREQVSVIGAILTVERDRTRLLGISVPSHVVIEHEQGATLMLEGGHGSSNGNGHSGSSLMSFKPVRVH